MQNYDLMCMSLAADMSDDEIKECVQQMLPVCVARGQGFCLTISGYDEDPRDLWQIPEAVSFMQRLVKFGLITALEVSTSAPEFLPERFKKTKMPGFGALEIWLCATNRMRRGGNDVSHEEMNLFMETLNESNRVAEGIMKEPAYKTGIKSNSYRSQIPDAPIKHHGFNKDRGPRWKPR